MTIVRRRAPGCQDGPGPTQGIPNAEDATEKRERERERERERIFDSVRNR